MIDEVVVTLISVFSEEGNGTITTWRIEEADKVFVSKISDSSPLNGLSVPGRKYLVEVKS